MRIVYLTGRYPEISHTFVLREVGALRRLGVDVLPIAIWRTDASRLLAPADRREAARTFTVLPPRASVLLRAVLSAALRRPGALGSTACSALALSHPGVRGRLMALLWLIEAVVVWDRCRRVGVRHIHAHLNGTAPTVALLTTRLGNGHAASGWTWSMTVHGPTEFSDVDRESLAAKVRAADRVIAISDFARSQLMALVEEHHWDKIDVVRCGVDPTLFVPQPRPDGVPGRLHVLNVGRLTPTKGTALLLEAIAELVRRGVDATATIVGDGPRRDQLERLAAQLQVADRVSFAGAVGQDRIRSHYAEADAFCLPSFAEGVPVVLMEAMAMEVPVVATGVMGVGELVDDGVSGLLVRPGRAGALADALEELAGDLGLRRRLGAAGRATVLDEFDVRRSAERLVRVFSELAVDRIGPGPIVARHSLRPA